MPAATATNDGYATSVQITKLDGIATSATANTKATGAEVDTGTDDTKFLTAKAVNDSHNVPDVAPGTAYNVLKSNGTDWISGSLDYVNVKDFGAVGDGLTDDSTAINAALNGGSKRVYIPAGIYILDASLVVYSNTLVYGDGEATILYTKDAANVHAMINSDQVNGNLNITLRDFKVDGNKVNQTGGATPYAHGVYMALVDNLLINGVRSCNCEHHGIHVSNSTTSYRKQRISDCLTDSNGMSGTAISLARNIVITNCHSNDNTRTGFRIESLASNYGALISNCVASGNGDGGIVPVQDSYGIVISNCKLVSNGISGSFDGIRMIAVYDVAISNCYIARNDGSGIGIYAGCKNIAISNCIIISNGQSTNALSTSLGQSGISIKNSATANSEISIIGCHLYDNQATKTQDYGIELGNTGTNVLIDSNIFGANQTAAMLNTSTGTGIKVTHTNIGLLPSNMTGVQNVHSFAATPSVATTLVDATPTKIIFDTEEYDYNSNFAGSTYTAPFPMVLHVDAGYTLAAVATGVLSYAMIYVNGVVRRRGNGIVTTSSETMVVSADILLAAGDTIDIYGYQDSAGNEDTVASSGRSYFSGHLVHKV